MVKRKPWHSGISGLLLAALLLSIMTCTAATRVNAASSSEIRNQIGALESQQSAVAREIADLESRLAENITEMEELVQQKLVIDQQIFLLYDQIANINEQIAAYGVLIADKQDELDAAEARHDKLKEEYKARIRAMEEDGTVSYWSVLFKSQSFSDFLDRMNMIEEIAASDHRRLMELQDAKKAVEEAQAALAEEKAAAEETKHSLVVTQEELTAKQEAADALLRSLRAKGDEFEQYLEQAEIEQNVIMQQIAQKNSELADAQYQEWLATYVPPSTTETVASFGNQTEEDSTQSSTDPGTDSETESDASSDASEGNSGDEGWVTPVYGYYISSPFGPRINPFSGQEQWHEGIDMVCAGGNPIYATRSGVVTSASYNDSCGYYVYISHDGGYGSIYMHMTHYIVSYGEYVAQGQVIGYVGSTGESEVEHLHFGIAENGCYVNPLNYI